LFLFLDHALFNVCKSLELFKLFYKFYLIFDQKYSRQAKYPAGYTVSGPYRISSIRLLDLPDIWQNGRDAPDIRPDNPAFFDIRYPAGYQIALPDIR
jgi:hypothetical protein